MRSDKTHGHKPRRHIKLLLFLTGGWREGGGLEVDRALVPGTFRLSSSLFLSLLFSYGILCHTWVRRSPIVLPYSTTRSFCFSISFSFHRSSRLSFRFLPSARSPLELGLVAYHADYLSPAFRRASCLRPPTRRPDALPYHSIKFSHCRRHGFSRAWETYIHAWSLIDGYKHSSRRVCEKRLTNRHAINIVDLSGYTYLSV